MVHTFAEAAVVGAIEFRRKIWKRTLLTLVLIVARSEELVLLTSSFRASKTTLCSRFRGEYILGRRNSSISPASQGQGHHTNWGTSNESGLRIN